MRKNVVRCSPFSFFLSFFLSFIYPPLLSLGNLFRFLKKISFPENMFFVCSFALSFFLFFFRSRFIPICWKHLFSENIFFRSFVIHSSIFISFRFLKRSLRENIFLSFFLSFFVNWFLCWKDLFYFFFLFFLSFSALENVFLILSFFLSFFFLSFFLSFFLIETQAYAAHRR